MADRTWWVVSGLVSVILVVLLFAQWVQKNHYVLEPTQLTDDEAVEDFFRSIWPDRSDPAPIRIKTGVFIQSLKFFNSADVHLTGYIWQRYKDGVHDAFKPGPSEAGFVLPEQVGKGGDIAPREAYRYRQGDEEVIGWYFEATVRQPFGYAEYPFDHKTVWVRVQPKAFGRDVVLVPDFAAYEATGENDVFGIEKAIVLDEWRRENTFFDYELSNYDTNFGIDGYVGQKGFPELHYNIVIKRKFENAFIVNMIPLFVVAALSFGALLTVTARSDLAERHGFSTSEVIGTCSVLFFVVLLSHVQLREQFAGSGIVYLEYFYFLMYFVLLGVAVNTYLFATKSARGLGFIHVRDNLFPKVAFWPAVLSCMAVITWLN